MMLIPDNAGLASNEDGILRLERFVGTFYAFRDAGAELVLASPKGGFPWMGLAQYDQRELEPMRRFKADRTARDELNDTLQLEQIHAGDFDAAFCIGHPGPIWSDPQIAGALIAELLRTGKPVGVITSNLDLSPLGTAAGLLIMGDRAVTPALAAQALLGALGGSSSAKGNGSP